MRAEPRWRFAHVVEDIAGSRERMSDAWWPIPAACVLAVVLIAGALLGLDNIFEPLSGLRCGPWRAQGTAEPASYRI